MRKSIAGSFLFLRSRKGGDAYESDLNMAGKQSTKSKNQSKPKEEIIMSKKRSIKVYGQTLLRESLLTLNLSTSPTAASTCMMSM